MGVIGIELEDAIAVIMKQTREILAVEEIEVIDARGRILAQDLIEQFNQPPFPRSPLDGYTFLAASADLANKDNPVKIKVVDKVYAGEYLTGGVQVGEAVKITTGAPIPKGCNCVIRQEDIKVEDSHILVTAKMNAFENYCFEGEDFKQGDTLLKKGDKIGFVEMGILACAGCKRIKVYRRPRIALFATGDELLLPGETRSPGKIYDSNLFMLYGRLQALGMDVIAADQLKDDPQEAAIRLRDISSQADAIITTGGVSVGEKDIFHQIIPLLAAENPPYIHSGESVKFCERLFWRVLMKPGTPAMFSILNGIPMLNLSGNPFAAITTFELLARPMLFKMTSDQEIQVRRVAAVLQNGFAKESKGRRFIRACYNGKTVTMPEVHNHSSGVLASMKGCNCLIDIKANTSILKKGDLVDLLLL